MGGRGGVWRNWAGNQRCRPSGVVPVQAEADVVAAVARAAEAGQRVKPVGSGHSFTAIACTDGIRLDLSGYDRVLDVERATGLVRVEAGITLHALSDALADRGLALENLGDIAYQTISGATATGTHGTGIRFGVLATQIAALRLVTGSGEVVACSPYERRDVFAAAQVGLGAVGVVTELTLRCVPAFRLHAVEEPRLVDEVLEGLDEWVEGNDHAEVLWVPGTRWALTKTNRRTAEPPQPRPRWQAFRNDVLLDNLAFGAMVRAGRRNPQWIPKIARRIPSTGRQEYTDRSDRVFASPRLVRFVEMEYSVPREAFRDAFDAVRAVVRRLGWPVGFPVECRFVAGDDIPLSTAQGGDRAYLAVHVEAGTPHHEYFSAVEAALTPLGGRPHWGKLHGRRAADLAPAYPRWDDFQRVRAATDPAGTFANLETDRVLGPVGG